MKIAIASGKGGTGKTTLATNLAAYLAENYKVILGDLDVEEPNSGLFIKGKTMWKESVYRKIPKWKQNKCNFCGLCQDVCNFHAIIQLGTEIMVFPELCHSCYACSELCPTSSLPMISRKTGKLKYIKNDNLSFIEGRMDIGNEQAVPIIAYTKKFINNHFSSYNIKLYDCPPGTSCPVIEATKDVDLVILVTEPTPFGLHDLKIAVETMKMSKKDFFVVINRYGIGNADVSKYCEKENISILAKIPDNRRIAELYSQGRLIYKQIPEVKQALDNIKKYILNYIQGEKK